MPTAVGVTKPGFDVQRVSSDQTQQFIPPVAALVTDLE
jgi:hypothetical protein